MPDPDPTDADTIRVLTGVLVRKDRDVHDLRVALSEARLFGETSYQERLASGLPARRPPWWP